MKYIKYILSSFLLLIIVACSADFLPFLQFEVENRSGKDPIELDVDGKCSMERPIRITASDELEWAVTGDTWLRFQPQAGSGPADIAVTALVNTDFTKRTGTIKITCDGMTRSFQVTQAPSTQMTVVGNTTQQITYKADTLHIDIHSNTGWKAVSSQESWCSVSPKEGTGNATLNIIAKENAETTQREAVITITTTNADAKKASIKVIQGGYGATLVVSPSEMDFTDKGVSKSNTYNIDITTDDAVTLSSDSAWCILDKTSTIGSDRVIVTVKPNTGLTDREAHINVETKYMSRTVNVKQDKHVPYLTVSPTEWSVGESAEGRDFNIKTEDTWTATCDSAWVTIINKDGKGNGDAQLNVKVSANTTTKQRTAKIVVELDTLYYNKKETITITQAAHDDAITLKTTSLEVGESGIANEKIDVVTKDTWEAKSDKDWCIVTPTSKVTGNGQITVNVTKNETTEDRTATVTVTTNYKKKATLTVTQKKHNAVLYFAENMKKWENVPATGEESTRQKTFTFTTTDEWTATIPESDKTWCHLNRESGNSTVSNFTVTIDPNKEEKARSTKVTVSTKYDKQEIPISQLAYNPTLSISASSISLTESGTEQTVEVNSSDEWTATVKSGDTWCKVSKKDNKTLGISADANSDTKQRSTTITISNGYKSVEKTITVTQAEHGARLTVSPESFTLEENGMTEGNVAKTVAITTEDNWTATCESSWCHISDASGNGAKEITIWADANTDTQQRQATVKVQLTYYSSVYKNIIVTQKPHEPYLRIKDSDGNELENGATLTFDNAGNLLDSQGNIIPGGNILTIDTEDAWSTSQQITYSNTKNVLVLKPDHGDTGGTIQINFNTYNYTYLCNLTISLNNYSSFKKVIKIVKNKLETQLSISPNELRFTGKGDAKDIDYIDVTSDGKWKIDNNYGWVHPNMGVDKEEDGSHRVYFTVDKNTTGKERTAILRVKPTVGASEELKVIQDAIGDEKEPPGKDDNGKPQYNRRK